MRKLSVVAVCLLLLTGIPAAGDAAVPAPDTPFNAYDGFVPGGRQIGMGMAFSAVGGDPASVYFNPAGLSVKGNYFAVTYEVTRQSALASEDIFKPETLKDRNLIFLCLAGPKGAFSWRPLANAASRSVEGSDWRDTGVKINAYSFSASHVHSPALSSGLNISYLSGQIAQSGIRQGSPFFVLSDGYGFTFDYGLLFSLAPEVRLGLTLQNLGGFMWWEDFESEQLPFGVRTGFAYQITDFMTFAADWDKKYYRKSSPVGITHFGLEQGLGRLLMLRAGIYGSDLNDREKTHFTGGIGYRRNNYDLSLAGEKYRLDNNDVYRYVLSLNAPL